MKNDENFLLWESHSSSSWGFCHAHLILETNGGAAALAKPFHFELVWINDPSCEETI